MSRITELFGLYCANREANFGEALKNQMCPYTRKVCTKMRKSDPDVKLELAP